MWRKDKIFVCVKFRHFENFGENSVAPQLSLVLNSNFMRTKINYKVGMVGPPPELNINQQISSQPAGHDQIHLDENNKLNN